MKEDLFFLLAHQQEEVAIQLIENGHYFLKDIDEEGTPAILAATICNCFEVLKYLIEKKRENINEAGNNGDNALNYAAFNGNFNMCKYLIEKGIDIHHTNNKKQNALHNCFKSRIRIDVIDLLINNDINFYAEDSLGFSPIIHAVQTNNIEAVKRMTQSKTFNINKKVFNQTQNIVDYTCSSEMINLFEKFYSKMDNFLLESLYNIRFKFILSKQ